MPTWRWNWSVPLLLLGFVLLSNPRRASCAGLELASWSLGVGIAGFAIAAGTDIGFASYDIVGLAQMQSPNHDAAIAEVALMAPQIALSLTGIIINKEFARFLAPFLVVSTGILAHGIWALSTDSNPGASQALIIPLARRRF